MKRFFAFALIAVALAVPAQLPAGNALSGNYRLTALNPMGTEENTNWLFKLEDSDGKTTATLLSATAGEKAELVSFALSDNKVRLVVKAPAEQVFEGQVTGNGKTIAGVFGTGKNATVAYMAPTAMTKIEAPGGKKKDAAKDAKEKKKEQSASQKVRTSLDDLKVIAPVAAEVAKSRNPSTAVDINLQLAAAFLVKKSPDLAAQHALTAEKALAGNASGDLRIKVLQTAVRALTEAGNSAELKPVAERLEKLEIVLDEKYHETVPPFKAKPFQGRKANSNRVVVMELFTGAQCPPCVAADVAFDVLQKTYQQGELALIQYHLHIPGADPMTNSDTEGRAKYYKASSTPSTFFNGSKAGSGGGAMAAAEKKFQAYCKIIDPLLEEPAGCEITATAKRVNNKVQIEANVGNVAKPGKDIKLRLVLVEETIRYTGSNKLRFHHQVVRAMPGGVGGVAVTEPKLSTKNEVDLGTLRNQLAKYLDGYNLTGARAPFPQLNRPLDLTNLNVIALVQDDETQEILQAVQVKVID